MSGFISRAACHGRRPSSYANAEARERSALSTRMLATRDVVRFIVAPDGYGKTFLALEYAETMFAWAHTFWVNATSPCFIRDLDDGDIASACLASDAEAGLVVFDDVPHLDQVRMEAFSREIDQLLESRCEVIVTCAPACEMPGGLQRDRIRIDARDLLLDDVELDAARTAEERMRRPAAEVGLAGRVPSLVWASDDDAAHAFAKSALGEELPSDQLLAIATALVLQSGSFADGADSGLFGEVALSELVRDHPHLGFDEELDRFEATPLSPEALATPLKSRMADLVERSAYETPAELVCAWANVLVDTGRSSRACDLVRLVCPRRKRVAWLLSCVQALVSQACFYPMFRLARDQDSCKGAERVRLSAVEALSRMVLGDEEGALNCAKRHAFDAAAPADTRICSLLVAARLGTGSLVARARMALQGEADAEPAPRDVPGVDMRALARAWCAGEQGARELALHWSEMHEGGAGEAEQCLCASWLFGLLDEGQHELAAGIDVRACERYVRGRLKESAEAEPDYFVASAGLSFEEARDRGVRIGGDPLDTASMILLRRLEMSMLSQRRLFDDDMRKASSQKAASAGARPAGKQIEVVFPAEPKRSIPPLTVRLFGHFEVAIGGVPLDSKRFNRRTSQLMLALLAVNHGRELPREAIERAMWPKSTEEVAHKNFYTAWSNLRHALTLPDGTCPYLSRHQYGCMLEPRYVHSDVERLGEICRELLFGVPNVEKWAELFAEVDRDFSSELMPAESKNQVIVQARAECRTRLVDALVAATTSVIDIESPQWGVWFARAALSHDETREDAYVALMRAQIAGNQRTAAMMTYLKCRRVLSERLGIDPSPEITMLYESLLGSD